VTNSRDSEVRHCAVTSQSPATSFLLCPSIFNKQFSDALNLLSGLIKPTFKAPRLIRKVTLFN